MKIIPIIKAQSNVGAGCANRVKCEYVRGKHCKSCREGGYFRRGDF